MAKEKQRSNSGAVQSVVPDFQSDDLFADQASVSTQFRNETHHTLTISFRSGVRLTLPRSNMTQHRGGCLVARSVVRAGFEVKTDIDNLYIAGEPISDPVEEAWAIATGHDRDRTIQVMPRPLGSHRQSAVVYYVEQTRILKAGGSVYIPELDILVTRADGSGALPPPHPYTRSGSIAMLRQEAMHSANTAIGGHMSLRIIDRKQIYGNRYMSVVDGVLYFEAETDPPDYIQDGVYRSMRTVDTKTGELLPFETKYYTFEEAKVLPLFKSIEEALTFGHPDDLRKQEIDRLRHELDLDRLQIDRQRHEMLEETTAAKRKLMQEETLLESKRRQLEREEADHRERMARLKMEQEQREFEWRQREQTMRSEQIIIKHRLDERSDKRKVWLEILKFVPAVIGSIVTAAAVINKINESK